MTISHRVPFAAALLAAASTVATVASAAPDGFGVIAYWGESASQYSGRIPAGSDVVVNPNSGALGLNADQIQNWKAVIANVRAQGGRVLGYIPTGYDMDTAEELQRYNEIPQQFAAYKTTLGGVDGYFFDEAPFDGLSLPEQQKCNATPGKWANIRSMAAGAGTGGVLVWNAGWPGESSCFVPAAQPGEHVVVSESSYATYLGRAAWLLDVQTYAASLGIKTWVLAHSATQAQMRSLLQGSTANYVYVTSVQEDPSQPWGGPIWNSVPGYWGTDTQTGSERWCLKSLQTGGGC